MIDAHNNALLSDFGLSRICHDATRTHTTIREGGRQRFLAPELSAGAEKFRTGPSSDIFSFSMVIFNTWTCEVPFPEYNDRKAAAVIRKQRRPNKPTIHIGLPSRTEQELWLLLVDMWAHEASNRPSTQDMQRRLERSLGPFLPTSNDVEILNHPFPRDTADMGNDLPNSTASGDVQGNRRSDVDDREARTKHAEPQHLAQPRVPGSPHLIQSYDRPHMSHYAEWPSYHTPQTVVGPSEAGGSSIAPTPTVTDDPASGIGASKSGRGGRGKEKERSPDNANNDDLYHGFPGFPIRQNTKPIAYIIFTDDVSDPYFTFSNRAPKSVYYRKRLYPTAEHLFQAMRFMSPPGIRAHLGGGQAAAEKERIVEEIRNCPTVEEALAIARAYEHYQKKDLQFPQLSKVRLIFVHPYWPVLNVLEFG